MTLRRTGTLTVLLAAIVAACGGMDAGLDSEATTQANNEVARLEFDDGNIVTFHKVGDMIAIGELRHTGDAPHYVPNGQTPEEAFRELAPELEVPDALVMADNVRFPTTEEIAAEQASETDPATAGEQNVEKDHGGTRMPYSEFRPSCLFLLGPDVPGYRLTRWDKNDLNRDSSSPTSKAGSGWSMVGADLGEVRHELVRTGSLMVQGIAPQGHVHQWTWTSAKIQVCKTSCVWWGCTKICKWEMPSTHVDIKGVTSTENYHHCGFTEAE